VPKSQPNYILDEQIGFLLRKASQRNSELFAANMHAELTPTRFAVIAKLSERGTLSQNELGRHTAMDVATIKGVVERLQNLDLVTTSQDPVDGRKRQIQLTARGENMYQAVIESAHTVTRETLQPLTRPEAHTLVALLKKITR